MNTDIAGLSSMAAGVGGMSSIATGIGGLSSLAMNIFGNSGVENDVTGNRMATDLYGRPVFSTQSYQNSIDQLDFQKRGEIGRSALSGAGAGAAVGTAIVPGIGTAIGAGLGAIGGIIGGRRRRNQIRDEISNRNEKLDASVDRFNRGNKNFFEEDKAKATNSFLLSERSRRLG